ncbi:Uncharacterised protein [Segatella copri]|nr:Uncharacterised protein [Segatella copri]
MLTERARWLQAHRTGDARGLIGQDITEGILCNDDIEECRLSQYAHRSVVDEHIIGVYLRILWLHLLGNLTPETRRCQYVCLIYYCQVLVALHGKLESYLQDALNLRTGIDICIVCLIVILILLTEVHTASQLADNYEVSTLQEFILQW